jgi:hypothetical protein
MNVPAQYQIVPSCQAPVAHACNPSYSGGRDQEDPGLKPAGANSSARPYQTLHKNRAGGVAKGEGPEFKPQSVLEKKKSAILSHLQGSKPFLVFSLATFLQSN